MLSVSFQVIQPVHDVTERSGFWLVSFFFNEDVDLLWKTRTKAKFWSGFGCRELNSLLSSLSRKEFVGGRWNWRGHQSDFSKIVKQSRKTSRLFSQKQFSEPCSRSATASSVLWKPPGQLGSWCCSYRVQNHGRVAPSGSAAAALLWSSPAKWGSPWEVSWEAVLLQNSQTPSWPSWQSKQRKQSSLFPPSQLAARESTLVIISFPVST